MLSHHISQTKISKINRDKPRVFWHIETGQIHGTFAESLMVSRVVVLNPSIHPIHSQNLSNTHMELKMCARNIFFSWNFLAMETQVLCQHLPLCPGSCQDHDLPRSRRTLAFQFFLVQKAVLTIALNKAPSSDAATSQVVLNHPY